MLRAVLLAWLAAVAAAAQCPTGYFFATGFTPANSFDQFADLRYYNRGRPYFSAEAHKHCSRFPVYMADMNYFGARFTRLCLDKANNARYSFTTPDPCQKNKAVNGVMYLGARPRKCATSQLEIVPKVWEQAYVSLNPDRQAPLKCPPAYTPARLPQDRVLLKTFLASYFTQSVYISKLLDRYDNNLYCDDAFRSIAYSELQGCIRKPSAAKNKAQVLAHGKITFQCYVRGVDTPVSSIGLTVKGDYSNQCKPTVKSTWN
ncbi:hypothetical protein D9Q98_004829 [Chlorella vulgaris]|uniref:Uncharacterized protein n=1 Tax=Chlorella vulgaris TaxID=3077 RepID=A0A9D4TN61_CHLVU|nr:hypothetical protein D9Q98_004829 [Chlorella vulgaris]